ncbi:uncharacterized protein FPOAC1_012993 [Fusarium poae]|uniref:uncharacterized protein n=1 Tax=Fusarium poae TaxID=36050 RepID=UPI001D04B52C|nr:uncharacterized protein FPOAC1_012993 [Fusarium poae]KAG8665015.1 hypothetical protein FPOAC1_012993 [Fusarium poae]
MDVDLNIELLEIPEFRLEFQFDGLEVYMLVDTVLSAGATYTLSLYTSTTPAGFAVRHNLEVGVIFTIDLIVSVEGEIDISTGFHLKLDDGVTIELGIFSKEISNMVINGGEFEFLPVSVESAGVVFKAVLRVGIQAGFEISSSDVSIAGKDIFRIGAGIETGVYANIAELITNVTLSTDGDDQCGIRVAEAYQFAVGATAGASIAIEDITWGPAVETEVPIFYTTLAQACAMQRSSGTISASKATLTSAALVIRGENEDEAEMETTTISEEATFIAVAFPTDSEAFFPESVRFSSVRPIPFGDSARKLFTTSGIPGSYVPQPPTHSATISAPGDGDGAPFLSTTFALHTSLELFPKMAERLTAMAQIPETRITSGPFEDPFSEPRTPSSASSLAPSNLSIQLSQPRPADDWNIFPWHTFPNLTISERRGRPKSWIWQHGYDLQEVKDQSRYRWVCHECVRKKDPKITAHLASATTTWRGTK